MRRYSVLPELGTRKSPSNPPIVQAVVKIPEAECVMRADKVVVDAIRLVSIDAELDRLTRLPLLALVPLTQLIKGLVEERFILSERLRNAAERN